MKNFVVALAVFCIAAGSTQAQKIAVGIKGGLNIADITNFDGDNRLSGHAGLFLNAKLDRLWSIQPELLYSGQGQQYVLLNQEYTVALSYLQVPVMIQLHPIRQFYVEFGPQLGFLLAANLKSDDNKTEIDDTYKKTEVSLGFGAGIQVTSMLGFYARYNAGISDITKNDNRDYFNRVGQIGVSIKLK